jgi:hypothetical protein
MSQRVSLTRDPRRDHGYAARFPTSRRVLFFMDRWNAKRPEALFPGPSRSPGVGNREAYMQQRLYWLDYDPVAFAVLVIGMGMIALLALLI